MCYEVLEIMNTCMLISIMNPYCTEFVFMLISSMNPYCTQFTVWFLVVWIHEHWIHSMISCIWIHDMIWTPVATVLDPVAAVLDVLWSTINYEYMYAN